NGCLCCVLKGDLVETFSGIHGQRSRGEIPWFDRVIVETTGLADPVPVIQTIVTDEDICDDFRLELVATLVDGVHGEAQLGQSAESVKQIAVADPLLISKTDLASAAGLAGLRERLRRVNPGASILDVHQGQIPLDTLLGGEERDAARKVEEIKRWLDAEARTEGYRQLPQGHVLQSHPDAHANDRHDPHLLTFSLSYEGPIRRSAVALWLNMLANFLGADLLRVKGILNVEGEPVVIHIVQTIVHEPAVLNQWPSDDRQSRIVFITRNIARSRIKKRLVQPKSENGAMKYG
ncbi:MAG: GTP-binding protein, partial [Pseudomonadota bacterium]